MQDSNSFFNSIANDYSGVMWDIGLYFLPGSTLLGLLSIPIIDIISETSLFKETSVLEKIFVFTISAYIIGQVIDTIASRLHSLLIPDYRQRYLKSALDKNPWYKQTIISCVLKLSLEDSHDFLTQHFNYEDMYFLCTKFIRSQSINLYNYYVGRGLYIAGLRVSLGVSFIMSAVIMMYLSYAPKLFILLSIILGTLLIWHGITSYKRPIFSIAETIYIICTQDAAPKTLNEIER